MLKIMHFKMSRSFYYLYVLYHRFYMYRDLLHVMGLFMGRCADGCILGSGLSIFLGSSLLLLSRGCLCSWCLEIGGSRDWRDCVLWSSWNNLLIFDLDHSIVISYPISSNPHYPQAAPAYTPIKQVSLNYSTLY